MKRILSIILYAIFLTCALEIWSWVTVPILCNCSYYCEAIIFLIHVGIMLYLCIRLNKKINYSNTFSIIINFTFFLGFKLYLLSNVNFLYFCKKQSYFSADLCLFCRASLVSNGDYPLYEIMNSNNLSIDVKRNVIEYLLKRGASTNAAPPNTNTPAYLCIEKHPELLPLFLSKGANLDSNSHQGYSPPPLYYAIIKLDIELAKRMIQNNAQIDDRKWYLLEDDSTLLHKAASIKYESLSHSLSFNDFCTKKKEMLQLLTCDSNYNQLDYQKKTPLQLLKEFADSEQEKEIETYYIDLCKRKGLLLRL